MLAHQAQDLQPLCLVEQLAPGAQSGLPGVPGLLPGQLQRLAQPPGATQQDDQVPGDTGGQPVITAAGGSAQGVAEQPLGPGRVHRAEGAAQDREVTGGLGGGGDAPQGGQGRLDNTGREIPQDGVFEQGAGGVPGVLAQQVRGGGQPRAHDQRGVLPALPLLRLVGDGLPERGQSGISTLADLCGGSGADRGGDTRMHPVGDRRRVGGARRGGQHVGLDQRGGGEHLQQRSRIGRVAGTA